jgi:type II secretory pathway pseudopilin PulG
MAQRNKKKQALTLLEIMIVIFLIGLIGSVIGYNMKGSLEEGKAFKTKQSIEKIGDILRLEIAKGASIEAVVADPSSFLNHSGLIKDLKNALKDGWNQPFEISSNQYGNDIIIKSKTLDNYNSRKNANLGRHASNEESELQAE